MVKILKKQGVKFDCLILRKLVDNYSGLGHTVYVANKNHKGE